MTDSLRILLLLLAALAGGSTVAQQPTTRPVGEANAPQPSAVERAIAQLQEQGLDAVRSFLRAGPASVRLLRDVLAQDELSERVRDLTDRALALCETEGEVSNGLKLGLSTSRDSLQHGESLKLTVTLCNVSDRPIRVAAGSSPSGNRFENGSLLRLVAVDEEHSDRAPQFSFGFCGTGAIRLEETLQPLTYRRFEIDLKSVGPSGELARVQHHEGGYFDFGLMHIFLPETLRDSGFAVPGKNGGDVVRLRLWHAVKPATDAGEPAPEWSGELTSETVSIELL